MEIDTPVTNERPIRMIPRRIHDLRRADTKNYEVIKEEDEGDGRGGRRGLGSFGFEI